MNEPSIGSKAAGQFRTLMLRLCIVAGVLLVVCLIIPKLVDSAPQDIQWRRTADGWQDTSLWFQPASIPFERRIELVHPAVFAALVCLAAVGMMLWSAEEWEIARLLEGKDAVCRRAKPRSSINDYCNPRSMLVTLRQRSHSHHDPLERESSGTSRKPSL